MHRQIATIIMVPVIAQGLSVSLLNVVFQSVWRLAVLVAAILCLSLQPAHAACTKWQAVAVWDVGTDEHRHSGVGGNKQTALGNARAACLKTAASDAAKNACRSAAPAREKYLCTDGKCIHVDIEDGLGWRRDQGWSREAFCIDRGFDGVIRDAADDQTGICFKGEC